MIGTSTPGIAPHAARPADEEPRLRQVAKQMEGVFVEQLYRAMRETVPEGGLVDGGAGEEIFTGMLDQHLAEQTPQRWEHGLGAALYRQLRGAAAAEPRPANPSPSGGKI